jgi:hypothetical protein
VVEAFPFRSGGMGLALAVILAPPANAADLMSGQCGQQQIQPTADELCCKI